MQSALVVGGNGPGLACSWVGLVPGILDGEAVGISGFRSLALALLARFLLLEPGREDDSLCRLFLSQTGVSTTLAGVCWPVGEGVLAVGGGDSCGVGSS